jgi:hypothetical protein
VCGRAAATGAPAAAGRFISEIVSLNLNYEAPHAQTPAGWKVNTIACAHG